MKREINRSKGPEICWHLDYKNTQRQQQHFNKQLEASDRLVPQILWMGMALFSPLVFTCFHLMLFCIWHVGSYIRSQVMAYFLETSPLRPFLETWNKPITLFYNVYLSLAGEPFQLKRNAVGLLFHTQNVIWSSLYYAQHHACKKLFYFQLRIRANLCWNLLLDWINISGTDSMLFYFP